jgi:hypothetical protein
MKDQLFYIFLGSFFGVMIGWAIFEYIRNQAYQAGYWAGRSSGWKASLEHQQKLQRMKSRAVFDYEKN